MLQAYMLNQALSAARQLAHAKSLNPGTLYGKDALELLNELKDEELTAYLWNQLAEREDKTAFKRKWDRYRNVW